MKQEKDILQIKMFKKFLMYQPEILIKQENPGMYQIFLHIMKNLHQDMKDLFVNLIKKRQQKKNAWKLWK